MGIIRDFVKGGRLELLPLSLFPNIDFLGGITRDGSIGGNPFISRAIAFYFADFRILVRVGKGFLNFPFMLAFALIALSRCSLSVMYSAL
jgi:hypothetical protein